MMMGKHKIIDSEYSKQAKDFLRKTGSIMSIVYVDSVPQDSVWGDDKCNRNLMSDKYKVTLKRGHKQFSFDFYGSHYDYERNLRPSHYDILACLSLDYYEGTIDDFVWQYGYEVKSWADVKRIEETYKAVCKQTKSLKRLYDDSEIEMLREIY